MRITRIPLAVLLSLVLLSSLFLSACSQADPTPTKAPPAPVATQPATSAQPTTAAQVAPTATAKPDPLAALAKAAEAEEPVIWYESSTEDQGAKVIAAFNKTYPKIKVQFVRVTGGTGIGGRVIQEASANARTADFVTSGISTITQINDRNLMATFDWTTLGVDKIMIPVPYALATCISTYVVEYNSARVAAADVPTKWDDLADPKWKGKVASSVTASGWAMMAKLRGDESTTALLEKFAAQQPLLYASSVPLASAVGSGEVLVADGVYHSAQTAVTAGAPIKFVFAEPVPIQTIFSGLTTAAKSPNSAKLFLAWLHTTEGARAYEAGTDRGTPLLPTKTAEMLKGKATSEWPVAETAQYQALLAKYNKILASGGKTVN